jgi:hypothetical protein
MSSRCRGAGISAGGLLCIIFPGRMMNICSFGEQVSNNMHPEAVISLR